MAGKRTRSSEPEPTPDREPGYYWVLCDDSVDPEIAYYGGITMRDQDRPIWDATGQPINARILSEYDWDLDEYSGRNASVTSVLSERILPPEVK